MEPDSESMPEQAEGVLQLSGQVCFLVSSALFTYQGRLWASVAIAVFTLCAWALIQLSCTVPVCLSYFMLL